MNKIKNCGGCIYNCVNRGNIWMSCGHPKSRNDGFWDDNLDDNYWCYTKAEEPCTETSKDH